MPSQLSCVCFGDYVNVDAECCTGNQDSENGKAYISAIEPTVAVRYVTSGLLSLDIAHEQLCVKKLS